MGLACRWQQRTGRLWREQVAIKQDQTRGFRAGERESGFVKTAIFVDDAGIGGAGVRKHSLAKFGMDAAEMVAGQHGAQIAAVHADLRERGVAGWRGLGGWSRGLSQRCGRCSQR